MHDTLSGALVILIVNAGVAMVYCALRRWFAPVRWGYIGLMMIFLPMGFDALDLSEKPLFGGTTNLDLGFYILSAVIGVFILSADLGGKIGSKRLDPTAPTAQQNNDSTE